MLYSVSPDLPYLQTRFEGACVDYFGRALALTKAMRGIPIVALHGKVDAKHRTETFIKFRDMVGKSV